MPFFVYELELELAVFISIISVRIINDVLILGYTTLPVSYLLQTKYSLPVSYSTPTYRKENQANTFPIYDGSNPPPVHTNSYNWEKKVQTN